MRAGMIMKKFIIAMLAVVLAVSGCSSSKTNDLEKTDETTEVEDNIVGYEIDSEEIYYAGGQDSTFFQGLQDEILMYIEGFFDNEDYQIGNIETTYYSNEYLEELEYNSKENNYFGYTLKELDAYFEATPYVFTLDDEGSVEVVSFEQYDDTWKKTIRNNMGVGAGVIAVDVTLGLVGAATGNVWLTLTFFGAAKEGTKLALVYSAVTGVLNTAITQVMTGDTELAFQNGLVGASESFKYGAVIGSIAGGLSAGLNALEAGDEVIEAESALSVNELGESTLSKEAETLSNACPADGSAFSWRESELYAEEVYGGEAQVVFKDGVEVSANLAGATRPDVYIEEDGIKMAIEVKNYDLSTVKNINNLIYDLRKEMPNRIANMASDVVQILVLDTRCRNYEEGVLEYAIEKVEKAMADNGIDLIVKTF
jgi:hypothetical protein